MTVIPTGSNTSVHGGLEVVKYLKEAGADVHIQDRVWSHVSTLMIRMDTQH